MRLTVLFTLIYLGGCAAPQVLISKPQPKARIGIISLVNRFPSHFVQYQKRSGADVKKVASMTNFADLYLQVVIEPLTRSDFEVHVVPPTLNLLDRRQRLFDSVSESLETEIELAQFGAELNFDYLFVIYPFANYKRQHSRFRSDRLFLEGYGMYSLCGDFQCRNWAINSVSVQIFDVGQATRLSAQEFDFFFWDYMPEESLWEREEEISDVPGEKIDQAAKIALTDFRALYMNTLQRGRFLH